MSPILRLYLRIRSHFTPRLPHRTMWTTPVATTANHFSHSGTMLLMTMALVAQVVLAALLGHASAATRANAASAHAGAPAAGRWVGLSSLQTGGASATPAASVPALDHVFTVVMENHTYSEIIGDTTDAPYSNNTLIPSGALATNYDAVTHPSLSNYIGVMTLGRCSGTFTPSGG